MKIVRCACFFLFFTILPLAVANDGVTQYPGKYRRIDKNNQQIHILEIDPREYKVVLMKTSEDKTGRDTVSALVSKTGALAGINGGYFSIDESSNANPAGALKIQKEWLGLSKLARVAIGWNENHPSILVDRIIVKRDKNQIVNVLPQVDPSKYSQQQWEKVENIVGGVGLLMKNGKIVTNQSPEKASKSFLEEKHARTAVCMNRQRKWMFVVASHTKKPARPHVDKVIEGLTILELAKLMKELGCQDAVNLDGGGSSVLVLDQEVVNDQAGDMDDILHLYHERPVFDAILVFPRTNE